MNRRDFVKCAARAAAVTATSNSLGQGSSQPVVPTKAGPVRGRMHDGIAVFLGIPYGADTRERRFQAPVPPAAWTNVRDAFVWGDRAPQLGGNGMTARAQQRASSRPDETYRLPPDEGEISEDCLHVNVWTPSPRPRGHER